MWDPAEKRIKVIWGLLSPDNLNGNKPNLYNLTDALLTYDRKTKKYSFGIEAIYWCYDDDLEGEIQYLDYILDEFKKWMIDNGYDINRKPDFYELFTKRLCGLEFDTIEKCYSYFKFLVDSYKMQNKVKLEKLK